MRTKNKYFIFFISIIIFSGCTLPTKTKGRDISIINVPKIIIGKSDKNQVKSFFGNPDSYQTDIYGNETWVYSYATQQRTVDIAGLTKSVEQTEKSIRVTFSKNNIVSDCLYFTYSNVGTPNTSMGEVGAGIGNKTTNRCEDVKY